MKQLLLAGICMGALALGAAEKYQSPGFSADIDGNGAINRLSYQGMPLIDSIGIVGEYSIPEGTEKHDARFFQVWDYSNKAQFKRDGSKLTVTVDSTLSNQKMKDAANYKMTCVLEPEKLSFSYEVIQKADLQTTFRLFKTHLIMVPSLFGRGIKAITGNGQEEFKVLPEAYNPKFRLAGKSLFLSTEKGVLALTGGKDVTFDYMDSRMWGGKDFSIIANPFGKWTPKPVMHPAGTVWKWDFSIAMTKDKAGK